MDDQSNTSEKLDMNYAANAMFVLTLLFLGYMAASIDTFDNRIAMIALVLSILYVGLQIGRVASKLQ